MREKKARICLSDLAIVGPFENCRCFSKAGEHKAVPSGQDFLVSARRYALLAPCEELLASAVNNRLQVFSAHLVPGGGVCNRSVDVQNVLAFEVPTLGNVKKVAKEISMPLSHDVENLLPRPDEKLAFLAF